MEIGYDEMVRLLRGALVDVARNARSFGVHARGRPQLLSAHAWRELAQIEALLGGRIQDVIQLELHVEPWSGLRQMRALVGGVLDGLRSEEALVRRVAAQSAAHPVAEWRAGAPQLENDLWELFEGRTHYLANTCALALDEPTPYPPRVWNPRRRAFS